MLLDIWIPGDGCVARDFLCPEKKPAGQNKKPNGTKPGGVTVLSL